MTGSAYLQELAQVDLCVLVDVHLAQNLVQLVFRHVFTDFLLGETKRVLIGCSDSLLMFFLYLG